MRSTATAILCAAMTTAAIGAEKPIHLKQAPGLDKVEANCTACHSLDYVQMNSNFLNAAGWNAEVAKMINAFGAPISPTDAKIIAEYLTANYGRRSPATADRSRAAGAQQPGKHRLGMGLLRPIHAKPSAGSRAHFNRPLIHHGHHAIAVLRDQKCSARRVEARIRCERMQAVKIQRGPSARLRVVVPPQGKDRHTHDHVAPRRAFRRKNRPGP